jgi:hypothetical protein
VSEAAEIYVKISDDNGTGIIDPVREAKMLLLGQAFCRLRLMRLR